MQEEFLKQSQTPFEVALATYLPIVWAYVQLGDPDSAQDALDVAHELVMPPLDQFLAFGEAMIMIERGDFAGAESAIESGTAIIEQFKMEHLMFQVDLVEGIIQHKRGDYAGSAESFREALDKIEHSILGSDSLNQATPGLYAILAESLVLSGDLDSAEKTLGQGFQLDPSEPLLWVSKSRFQLASGLPQLAQASVNYALAIWKDADPQYKEYIRAQKLEAEIQKML